MALLTDGLEDACPRIMRGARATSLFFDMIAEPIDRPSRMIPRRPLAPRPGALSAALARYLDGERVNERTDDDRTLAVAVRRGRNPHT